MLHCDPATADQIRSRFQIAAGQWRLFGIGVATPEVASAQPQAQALPAKPALQVQKKPQ